jgi:hypothetical protein
VRVLAALGAVLTVVGAGCGGAEDDTQRFAREATESYLADEPAYDVDEVHCTSNPRPWFVERQATVFICAARRVAGGCDWFRVELTPSAIGARAKVDLEEENAGCVLPA